MVAHTRRISPWSGLNVGTAMPCARPVRPAWSEPSPEVRSSTSRPRATVRALMGDWYTVGILVGLGASIGVAATGALRRALAGLVVAVVAAVAIGYVFGQWDEAAGGAFGAICGSL